MDTIEQDGLAYNGATVESVSGTPQTPAAIKATTLITSGTGTTLSWDLGDIVNTSSTQPYVFKLVFTATVTGLTDDANAWLFFPPSPNDDSTFGIGDTAQLSWYTGSETPTITSQRTLNQVAQPLLKLTKTANPNTHLVGGQVLTYSFQIDNLGSSPAMHVIMTDTVPAGIQIPATLSALNGITLAGYEADPGAIAGTGGTVTITMGSAISNSLSFSLPATVTHIIPSALVLTNLADVDWASQQTNLPGTRIYHDAASESAWTQDSTSADTVVQEITTTKSVWPNTSATNSALRIGDVVTYTLVNTVAPHVAAYWPYQIDYLDRGFSYITGSFGVTIDAGITGAFIADGAAPNTPSAITSGNPNHHNPNVGNYSVNTNEQALEWWMTPITNTTGSEQTITFTLRAQYVGVDTSSAVVYPPPDTSSHSRVNYEQLAWNITDSGSYTVTNNHSTDIASAEVQVGQPNLNLTKYALSPKASGIVGANQVVTYLLVITNNGTTPAYDVIVSDAMPLKTSLVTATLSTNYQSSLPAFPTAFNAPDAGSRGPLTFTLDQLPGTTNVPNVISGNTTAAKVVSITLVALTDPDIGANITLTNSALVNTYDSQPNGGLDADDNAGTPAQRTYTATNVSSVTYQTVAPALNKQGTPKATIGQMVTYTVLLPATPLTDTLYNVFYTDVVTSALRVESMSFSGGTGIDSTSGNTVTLSFASIPSTTQVSVFVTATVLNVPVTISGTKIVNTAQASYATTAGGTSNKLVNSSPFTTTVIMPNLAGVKRIALPRNPPGAGDVVTYTLVYTNIGNSPAYDVVVTDTLPTGVNFGATTFVSVTNPTTVTAGGDYPLWDHLMVNPGGVINITFNATIDPLIGSHTTLTNTSKATYRTIAGR